MKTVYALRGPAGAGKSTFIKENNLEANTLSLDTFRELFTGLVSDENGNPALSQRGNENIVRYFNQAIDQRMFQGGALFIDNLNLKYSDLASVIELSQKHGYEVKVIDFSDITLEQCLENNKGRSLHKRMQDFQVKGIYKKMLETRDGFKLETEEDKKNKIDIPFITREQAVKEFSYTIEDTLVDLSAYKKVHHIGDLQGCFEPLQKYFKQNGGIKDDEFYIFVGDYVDRGIENDLVVKWLLEDGIKRDNMIFLKGNHERHIIHYANDIVKPSKEFLYRTLPQLKKAGIDKKEMKELVPHLKNFFAYEYEGKKVFVTHAGVANIPSRPALVNQEDFLFGFGGYGYDVDGKFTEKNEKTEWHQVHGHRNYREGAIDLNLKSFALESDVEFNGYLSCLTLDEKGFGAHYVPSNIYNKDMIKKLEKDMFETRKFNDLEKFITHRINSDKSAPEMLQMLRENDLIREKEFGHISSFNFTRQAFFKKSFENELVSTARGLFINNETGEIVARGYDKFFNINERGVEISKIENVKDHTQGPYTCYEKENGFLGVSGYDSKTDTLFTASKSTPESDFAGWFRDILSSELNGNTDALKKELKKLNASAVFEVNDPINDPHIVEYDKPHVVLLDVIKRDYEFTKMKYEELKKFGEKLGLTVKKRGPTFKEFQSFEKFFDAVSNEDPFETNRKLEGYVVEDVNGNMNKIKLPFYNFWKEMRGLRDKIISCETKGKNYTISGLIEGRPLLRGCEEKAENFMKWALDNYELEDLKTENVISLRNNYFAATREELKNKNTEKRKMKP